MCMFVTPSCRKIRGLSEFDEKINYTIERSRDRMLIDFIKIYLEKTGDDMCKMQCAA